MVNERTCDMCVAHRHRPNSHQQLHKGTNAHRPTRLPFETTQNDDNYLKDGLLMLPCHPTHTNNIETLASIPCQSQWSHQTSLRLFDLYFARSTSSLFKLTTTWVAGKTGHRLTPALCVVDRGVWMVKFNPPQSKEFDQRTTSTVHSMQS